ncbi:DUF4123 domain-containing protein [Jannaschia marina]|uniref:DUF4123 domain-containing protein n=1 Tax=Jannaschia marina TaxID=2741674 RepID=UPI0015CAB19F|nr:DUF4123 domain-containing protein [Jannaschia marina]
MEYAPTLTGLSPLDHDRLLDLLFDDGRKVYLMLDAARVVGLAERLDHDGAEAVCLLRERDAVDLGDHLPWIAHVTRDDRLLLDTMSDVRPRGLWNVDPGLFLLTDWDLSTLTRHLRKFHRPTVTPTGERLFLRFWDMDLILGMLNAGVRHMSALVGPELSLVGRVDGDVYVLHATEAARDRPGTLTEEDRRTIGSILTTQRRALLADRIAETFPDHVSHLSRRALEREVHDAWSMANAFRLRNGQVRAKFIITSVALAPGLHRQDVVRRLFEGSDDPDQSFRDLDTVLNRRFDAMAERMT